jgi:hypothetical protein
MALFLNLCLCEENFMRTPLTIWIVLGLAALLLAACGPAGGDEAVQVDSVSATEGETAAEDVDSAADSEAAIEPTANAEPEPAPKVVSETEEPAEAEEAAEVVVEQDGEESPQSEEPAESEASSPATDDGILTVDDRSELMEQVTVDWATNWRRHTVPYDELIPAQLRDRIRSIDAPTFISSEEAAEWLADNEPVIAFELDGDARAYPLQILTLHEIVNDVVAGVPVAVTFCPLCNSAIVLDSRLDDMVLEFGTSGLLRFSDLVMYDRTTESLWQQFTGEGLVGDLAGRQLTLLPSSLISFADFRAAFPEGQVLSNDTGFPFSYGLNPYAGYDSNQHPLSAGDAFPLFTEDVDGRLESVERVVSVAFEDGTAVAYPVTALAEVGVVNDTQGDNDLVIFHTRGTSSAMGAQIIADGRDIGATSVFDPNLDGQKLTFSKDGDNIVDDQTGSIWNVLGQAVEGPLAGEILTPVVHGDHFWFSWAAFHPDTVIYNG